MRTVVCEPSERVLIGVGPRQIEVVVVGVGRGRVRLEVRPPADAAAIPAERMCTLVPGWPDVDLNAMGRL